MNKPLNILILEDEVIIARSLERIVTPYATVKIAHDYNTAAAHLIHLKPSLVLLDINLRDSEKTGIDFAREFKDEHQFEIIFITAYFDSNTFSLASKLNPLNYIVKPFKKTQVEIAVQLILNQLIEKKKDNTYFKKLNLEKLTKVEKQVLQLISLGLSSKLIALELNKSSKTVLNHRSNIIKKIEITNTNNALLIWSIENRDKITSNAAI